MDILAGLDWRQFTVINWIMFRGIKEFGTKIRYISLGAKDRLKIYT